MPFDIHVENGIQKITIPKNNQRWLAETAELIADLAAHAEDEQAKAATDHVNAMRDKYCDTA